MLVDRVDIFGWSATRAGDPGEQWFDHLFAQQQIGTHRAHAGWIGAETTRAWRARDEIFTTQFRQVISCMTSGVSAFVPATAFTHLGGHLRHREAIRCSGKTDHGVKDMTVAGFIQIDARQSPVAACARLAPPFKRARIEKAHVRGLHGRPGACRAGMAAVRARAARVPGAATAASAPRGVAAEPVVRCPRRAGSRGTGAWQDRDRTAIHPPQVKGPRSSAAAIRPPAGAVKDSPALTRPNRASRFGVTH